MEMTSSTDVSPTITPCGTPSLSGAPKYGTVIPNRIFVGGIAANTTELELKQFFTCYGAVKDAKIIADRAGVSKGYGFITFENQEDADRILKKEVSVESDNIVFRDRKLNIGPAIRKQQVLPRAFDSPTLSPGAVMFSNGVPYTYQNGMAVFASPDTGYTVPPAQPQTALMMPQSSPVYVHPQYAAYQVPVSYASLQTSPQWTTAAAAAAANHTAANQWRYMTQSPTAALTAPANPYLVAMQPTDVMYAQVPSQGYQPDLTDTALLEGTAGVEGSILPMGQSLQPGHLPVVCTSEQAPAGRALTAPLATLPPGTASGKPTHAPLHNSVHTLSVPITSSPLTTTTGNPSNNSVACDSSLTSVASGYVVPACNIVTPSSSLPAATCNLATNLVSSNSAKQLPSVCNVNVAPYRVPLTSLSRRGYTSPYLVRNGHKVQCVMVPPKHLSSHLAVYGRPAESITPPTGAPV